MNFRDVGVKKMDEAFSRDKMWRIRKIFCPILWNKKKKNQQQTRMNFLVPSSVLNIISI